MITIKIASIPDRIMQLEQTIYQFLKQTDKIEVYLNNYAVIPQFLIHKKYKFLPVQNMGIEVILENFFK